MSDQAEDPHPFAALAIDPASSAPPFRQLHDAVLRGVSEGRILPGQRLPPIRSLAAELGLAAGTVAAAYRSLDESGVVEGRGRAGTFVSLGDDPVTAAARRVALDAAARLRGLGLDADRARRMLVEAVDASPES